MSQIKAHIKAPPRLRAVVQEAGSQQGSPYTGDYTVTPKAHTETILPTKNKHLTEDVQVLEIPYYEVSNAAGGSTVYIAKEI